MRNHHKKELTKSLSHFEKEDLCQLIWAANTIQSRNFKDALRFLDRTSIDGKAIGVEDPHELAIHKWELETLFNEGLATPLAPAKNGKLKRFRSDYYGNIVGCVNRLRKLENKEFSIGGHRNDVLLELVRIGNRQFPWQVGSDNISNLYRNVFVYGQGKCAETFERRHGISVGEFTKVAFGLYAHFTHYPALTNVNHFAEIGVSRDLLRSALSPLCLPIDSACCIAARNRAKVIHIAYKPSVLRSYPCINFGGKSLRVRSPLPQLILDRMTSGLFYDVVAGGGEVREEYGRRFEAYCLEYSRRSMPDFLWEPEQQYKVKKQPIPTPDLLCFEGGKLILVAECKATRMSREAMYGKDPLSDRGFEDLVKAVKQLWRFFAHCRLGFCQLQMEPDAVGMVLTLDSWLVLAEKLKREVLRRAEQEILTFSGGIVQDVDKRKIIFAPIQQYERVLSHANKASFIELLAQAGAPANFGWNLDMIHEDLPSYDPSISREFPFKGEVKDVLPWWEVLEGTES